MLRPVLIPKPIQILTLIHNPQTPPKILHHKLIIQPKQIHKPPQIPIPVLLQLILMNLNKLLIQILLMRLQSQTLLIRPIKIPQQIKQPQTMNLHPHQQILLRLKLLKRQTLMPILKIKLILIPQLKLAILQLINQLKRTKIKLQKVSNQLLTKTQHLPHKQMRPTLLLTLKPSKNKQLTLNHQIQLKTRLSQIQQLLLPRMTRLLLNKIQLPQAIKIQLALNNQRALQIHLLPITHHPRQMNNPLKLKLIQILDHQHQHKILHQPIPIKLQNLRLSKQITINKKSLLVK